MKFLMLRLDLDTLPQFLIYKTIEITNETKIAIGNIYFIPVAGKSFLYVVSSIPDSLLFGLVWSLS